MILNNFFEPRKKSILEDLNQTTQSYSMGPLSVKQTTDAKGKVVSRDAEVDFGVGKFATGQAGGITSKAYTPAPGQEGMSGRDLYSMGNAGKAATYDRATAAVNEAPRAPGSPALAAPKAPRAPAAPRLEEDDVDQPDNDFDSWEQNGDTAVPVTKGGVRQNLYKMPVNQVPQGAKITQKYSTYQQQGAHAFPVEPNGGIQQLAKIPVSQVPKGANIIQAPTPDGNLYKNLPAAPALEEDDQPIDKELVKQIYKNNRDIIGPNMNLIQPKTIIDLPDGTPYEIQPGDTLSKIARKLPVIKAAAQSQIARAVAPTDAVAAEPGWADKVKQAASGLAAGQLPSQAIPAAFPSLKKPVPAAPAATTSGTIVNPDWSQTRYNNLGPLVKGSDGVWRTQDGKMSATDPEIIAMAEKLAKAKTAPAPVARALTTPMPIVKAPPEMVAPADSLDPGEEIVTKSKVKPHLPPRSPTPKEPTGIAAAADKLSRLEKGAETKIGQAYNWLANLVRGRESGGDYDIGYHYDPGTGKVGADKRLSSAWGAYGMTQAAIANARSHDPTLNKPIEQWTAKDQDRAFNYNNTDNINRMKTLGVDFDKHPEAPSIAMFLGGDGAAEYYKTGKFSKDTLDSNGGEKGVRKIIATRTKDALDAIEMQKKQQEKQKVKESAVAETIQTVKVMLETAATRDDVRRIKDYIDRQYTRHGLTDSVSFAQRNHLVERVIEITGKRLLLA
jgi:hypothetical protein